jgi:hypothetical protein
MNLARMALVPFLSLSLFTSSAQAEIIRIGSGVNSVKRVEKFLERSGRKAISVSFRLRDLSLRAAEGEGQIYSELETKGVNLTSDPGQPRLPFHAVTVESEIVDVKVKLGEPVAIPVGRIFPAQQEPCRCSSLDTRALKFEDRLADFKSPDAFYRVDSLGDSRGTPVKRVVLLPHRYDVASGTLYLYPKARYQISYEPVLGKADESLYDYLVIAKRAQIPVLESWLNHKRAQDNLRFHVVAFEDMNSPTAENVRAWIHAEYARARFRYSLIVGGDHQIPQMRVSTTTDGNTPSDLPFYTMGGEGDVVPEVHGGRVVADDDATLSRVLAKWIAYETDNSAAPGWSRAVGIASNEGSGPSDADYVQAIQSRFTSSLGTSSVYFYENNADSNPTAFNEALNVGAWWVTYLGHGSGWDWPSFGTTYGLADIARIRNSPSVKPVWIDVACLNGILRPTYAGAHLMGDQDENSNPIGTAAYYGGTVLISWHPPAIFARGLGYHVAASLRPTLGEAIQAGQRYLTENYSGVEELASTQRWYHLQGDPSMRLRVK